MIFLLTPIWRAVRERNKKTFQYRYGKYFLQHILWLDDGFNEYYVQDKAWGRQQILDVESVVFDWAEQTEQWLNQCAQYEDYDTHRRLRVFLSDESA